MDPYTGYDEKQEKVAKNGMAIDEEIHPVVSTQIGEIERTKTLERGLKSRHAQMIALGGTIGTGLFVGAGQALVLGGPLFLLLAYSVISLVVYSIATGLVELSAYLPVSGSSVPYFAGRYVSPSLGFALGWLYWYIFAITVPAEITATSLVIEYWSPPVSPAVWVTVSMVVIIGLNCMPVKYYGEVEFWFASLKVITIIGLIFMTVVLFFGGGPTHEPLYFHNWAQPVNHHLESGSVGVFCGFLSTLIFSYYAFVFAPELLVQTGGEMVSPRRNLPIAGRRYIWRLIIFYVLGALCIGILINSQNPGLLGGGSGAGSSPWALGIKAAGIHVLDSVVNAAILISAWSAGNSYLYLSSRALYSMAVSGNAPKIFTKCTKSGIPYYAVAASSMWAPLAYLNVSSSGAVVFNWFINIINVGGFESWIVACIIYIRFRKATEAQGITDIPYRSFIQPYASWITGTFLSILLIVNGYAVFLHGQWDVSVFLTSYIGVFIFAGIYFGHRFTVGRHDKWAYSPDEVDLVSGLEDVLALERPVTKTGGPWYVVFKRIYE